MSASSSSALDLPSGLLPAEEPGSDIKGSDRHDAAAQHDVPAAPDPDALLMQRYRAGDQEAFRLLYSRYRAPLRRFVSRIAGNFHEAEEIVQEVWTAVIHRRRSYRPTAKFSTYLFSIAHRRLQDRQRRYWRWKAVFGGSAPLLPVEALIDDKAVLPESRIYSAELRQALLAAIDTLPPPQREVFLLKAETELSLEEIAAATGANLEATKSRLRYAVARLRAQLRPWQ